MGSLTTQGYSEPSYSGYATLIILILFLVTVCCLVIGIAKTLDIQDGTYYDKELGRMVYIEEGV